MACPLRLIAVVLALSAVASVLVGAAGVSSMTADRPVQISVVDDDSAVIGVDDELHLNEESEFITNRFTEDVTLDVTLSINTTGPDRGALSLHTEDGDVTDRSAEPLELTLSPGEAVHAHLQANRNETEVEAVEFDIEAEGERVDVELTRTVDVVAEDADNEASNTTTGSASG